MDEDSKDITAFLSSDGLFRFNVMPIGLCNNPSTFSGIIDEALGDLKFKTIIVHLDEVQMYFFTLSEHPER